MRHDSRHDTAAPRLTCAWCGAAFTASGRRRFCSDAYRARRARARVPARLPRTGTVYECPGCESRYLGEQRCSDCNLFCRSLGPGGECPCCADIIAVAELLE